MSMWSSEALGFHPAGWAWTHQHQLHINSLQRRQPTSFWCRCKTPLYSPRLMEISRYLLHSIELNSLQKADATNCLESTWHVLPATALRAAGLFCLRRRLGGRSEVAANRRLFRLNDSSWGWRACQQQESISCLSRTSSHGYNAL